MPRSVHRCWRGLVVAVVLAAGTITVVPPAAEAQQCPGATPSYMDACGPTFAVPTWTDTGGWTDPSQYSTIQLADFNGDGKDELLARNDQGLELWWFDTDLGQWRPHVNANAVPQTLTDFRSPRPGETLATDWTKPEYYSTIQTAHINGNPNAQVLARFADGMRVYYFTPGPGGSIDGGSWSLISSNGPFSDADGWNDPSLYSTIRTGKLALNSLVTTDLVGRAHSGLMGFKWNGSGWSPLPLATNPANQTFADSNCGVPSCYLAFRTAQLGGFNQGVVGRRSVDGPQLTRYDPSAGGTWSLPLIVGRLPFSDSAGAADCPFPGTNDCLGSSPSYYETLALADFDGDNSDEIFARGADGLRVKSFGLYDGETTYDDWLGDGLHFGSGWTHATNVPGAIDGTESSHAGGNVGYLYFTLPDDYVTQVIGPVGPGLGKFSVSINNETVVVDQSAPHRLEQQVLLEAVTPNVGTRIVILAGPGTAVIDAIRTYRSDKRAWSPLAQLDALAGTSQAWASTPGRWASIRTGDINGDGRDEVLALDGQALQAWSYNPAGNAWSQLQPSTPLTLTGDWLDKPEYYSTIRTGDVDGDGRDDVVARGPYGIRTWFYNRRGTGGWERYLADGYPAFPGTATTPGQQNTGHAAAFDALNGRAFSQGLTSSSTSTLRERWTGEKDPDATTLPELRADIAGMNVGNCPPANKTHDEPPVYSSCTPPGPPAGGTNRFTEAEWTAVVNEMLREAFFAEKVLDQIDDLKSLREQLFISETAELPAIGDELALQAAANTPASFNFQSYFAGALGIAASIAGLAEPELSAALWVGSELASTIPAPSSTANSSFQTTYADLEHKFAAMVSETENSIAVQSQLIRQDEGLLELVGELRSRGTWAMDTIGIGSAANQGFAAWVYSTLMPTIYDRYSITNCRNGFVDEGLGYHNGVCTPPPSGLGVIGGGENFTMIGQRHQIDRFGAEQVPCVVLQDTSGSDDTCTWPKPPDDLLNRIWGPVPASCSYVPGQSSTVWTFGRCSAGVDVGTSIGDNSWGFPSYAGNPDPYNQPGGFTASASAARKAAIRTAQANPPAPIVLGRPRQGRRRAVRGRGQVRANTFLPRRMRLAGATVRLDRLLFDRRGRGELARPYGSRAPRPLKLTLRRAARGRFTAATTGRRNVRITLRRTGRRGRARLTLSVGAAAFRAPHACHALPASVAIDTPPLYLETRLAISHGRIRHRLRLEHHVRCVRDARGNVHRLVRVREPSYRARRGLTVSLHGPRRVQPGTVVSYVARLHNQRRGRDRMRSSLWDVILQHAARTTRIRELRRGRTRSVTFTRRVPRTTTRSRLCVSVVATAAGARAADARSCAAVGAALPTGTCAAESTLHRRAGVACAARVTP